MAIDENQKARNKSTNIKRNSLRHTIGLGTAVGLIRKRDEDFDSSVLLEILSNGGMTAFIITEYGRMPIPKTYWVGITQDDLPRPHPLNWLAVKYQNMLPHVAMQVVSARKFLHKFGVIDDGAAFEADYPDLALWLRTNPAGGMAQNPEEISDKLDELLAALAHPTTKKYLARVTRAEVESYIGGRNGLPKQKTGRVPSAMPDEFWLELLKYFTPFKNRLAVKAISGRMLHWLEDRSASNSLLEIKCNEVRIKEIVHSMNKIGKDNSGQVDA